MLGGRSRTMNTGDAQDKREAIIAACLQMNALGINQGTSGNISVRHGDGLLITPTRIPYDQLRPEDIVVMSFDGSHQGLHKPSSEWRFHCDVMHRRPDVEAIVHAHPVYATIIAIMGLDIPALHYMVAVAGGKDIRCAPYALFGSQALSEVALRALEGRRACLLGHHGVIAVGSSVEGAVWLAGEVETLARQFHGCLQIGGPRTLSDAAMDEVMVKIVGYAQ